MITAGSPLSYWQGVHGKTPMRYTGGLYGGSWLTALTGDLGAGIFDGAYLVAELREHEPVEHALDQAVQRLRQGRHRGPALSRLREVVGRPRAPQRRGDAVDRRQPVRRQQAGHGRDRHPRRGAASTCATSTRRSSASARRATTSPRRSRRWAGSSTCTTASTTSAPTARPSSTASTTRSGIWASSSPASVAKKEHAGVRHQHRLHRLPAARPLRGGAHARSSADLEATGRPRGRRLPGPVGAPLARRDPRAGRQRSRGRAEVRDRGHGFGHQSRPLPHASAALGPGGGDARAGRGACAGCSPLRLQYERSPTATRCCAGLGPLAEWVRQNRRRPAAADNPFLAWQEMVSRQIVAGARRLARSGATPPVEATFHAIYGSPLVQALPGPARVRRPAPAPARPRSRGAGPRRRAGGRAAPASSARAARARLSFGRSSMSACRSSRPTSAASSCCSRSATSMRAT